MKRADVTVERTRRGFMLRPETDRGRRCLEETVPGHWEDGALLFQGADVTPIVVALAASGFEVADAPRYYVQAARKTTDGETIS